jgi:hypothetical protein
VALFLKVFDDRFAERKSEGVGGENDFHREKLLNFE